MRLPPHMLEEPELLLSSFYQCNEGAFQKLAFGYPIPSDTPSNAPWDNPNGYQEQVPKRLCCIKSLQRGEENQNLPKLVPHAFS